MARTRRLLLDFVPIVFLIALLVHVTGLAMSAANAADDSDCVQFVAESEPYYGTFLASGSTITKTWTVKNCGETTWEDYKAVRTFGLFLGPKTVDIPKTSPGGMVDISVEVTIPDQPGLHDYYLRYEITRPFTDGRRMIRIGEQFWMSVYATDVAFE